MESLLQDLRYGLRVLVKTPGFTAVTIITLALGIGANTAVFSLMNAVLLRQLPFKDPDQLVWVWSTDFASDKTPFSVPDFIDYRDQNQALEQMSAFSDWSANLTEQGEPERLQGIRISANVFQMLGVDAVAGRTLLPDDDKPGNQNVVILTHGLWQRRFGSDQNLIGSTLRLNGQPYTVVGVLPPNFSFPLLKAELGIPLAPEVDSRRNERGTNFLRVIARLKPGVTEKQAQADLTAITYRLRQQYPQMNTGKTGVKIVSLHKEIVGDFRLALMVLFAAVALVLLIACANLANLLLVRAAGRHREIAIRTAMGATRLRLIRQLLTESLTLSLAGGMLGFFLASWGIRVLVALSPSDLPRAKEVNIDVRVLLFTLLLSLLAGVVFGLAPALQASKIDLNEMLKGGSRGSSEGFARNRARTLLLVSEVALSLVLLISAGLFMRSFVRLQGVNPGFDAQNLLAIRLSLPRARYSEPAAVTEFYKQLSPRIESLPGVQSVGAVSFLPLSGLRASLDFTIVGRPPLSPQEVPWAEYRMVNPGYFRTMKIPVLKGRDFTDRDTPDMPGVAIINDTLAQRFWPNENPIGQHMTIDDGDPPPRKVEIVGVVGNVKHFGLDGQPTPDIYVPFQQIPAAIVDWATRNMSWVVRTNSDPLLLAAAVRNEVQAIDKDVPASSIKTMEQYISDSVAPRRFNLFLLSVFACAALLLAAMGIYTVMSYSVTQRTREIGIRMALGAQQSDVLKLIIGQGLKVVLIGVVIGLVGAFALTRIISSLLFGVSASDPVTFTMISLLLTSVALLACYVSARKATRVNPVIALRYE